MTLFLYAEGARGAVTDPERLKLSCHCGWSAEGSREEVISATREHVLKVHWVEADDEDILELITPA
jgi:predicted small metal-binding protein